ncbi:MAG: FAD-dependent oxidoreductase [Candidatus Omnitrophica bacterium]|jgi:NADH dehydrogenase|nr:FAD-dependent oxidoreductase [Candidatus Omnitrophota bacterium]
MKKVIIIGGGFAGLSTASHLFRSGFKLEVRLIDKKLTNDFLPTLPDCLGRGINPDYLSYGIESAAKQFKFQFIHNEVNTVNLEKKEVFILNQRLEYDYLIIASGSETNFYGNENIKNNAYKLDSCADAKVIAEVLKQKDFNTYIISGGGYTGIEVATNLKLFLNKQSKNKRIIIVERAAAILGSLPEWMKAYVADNLKRLNIEVFTNSAIERIEGEKVFLSEGRVFENAMVIWAAGVKAAKFIQDLEVEKNPQGRIKVDEFLRLNDACFAVGDAAYFVHEKSFLRMAVQFAIVEGECAAINILRSIRGKPLIKYKPIDLGYIIPMANNCSSGRVLGVNLTGLLPTVFHFIMCIYRSYGMKNKLGIIGDLIRGGGK